jgi:hypothetical protein
MTYGEFLGSIEWYWLAAGVIGAMLSAALLSRYANERRSVGRIANPSNRAQGLIMGNALVLNEILRLVVAVVYIIVSAISLSTPNPVNPTNASSLPLVLVLTLLPTLSDIMSGALLRAYWKIDHIDGA